MKLNNTEFKKSYLNAQPNMPNVTPNVPQENVPANTPHVAETITDLQAPPHEPDFEHMFIPLSENSEFNLIDFLCDTLQLQIENAGSNKYLQGILKLSQKYQKNSPIPSTVDQFKNMIHSMTGENKPKEYDAYVNGCICYYGQYLDDSECPFCEEPRYHEGTTQGRNVFVHIPLHTRLKHLYKNEAVSKRWRYRADYQPTSGVIADVFDGKLYKELVDDGFFRSEQDMALAFSADGFKATKKTTRNKKYAKGDETWPFVVYNLNEPPVDRVKILNSFVLGVVVGKFQPEDISSFMQVFIENDFFLLQNGIHCYDGFKKSYFTLKAHVLVATGDYPGVSLFACFTGQNGKCGCRFCRKKGVWVAVSKHYYFPHHNDTLASIKGERRTPENTEQALLAIEQAKTMTEKKEVMKNSGIKGRAQLMKLESINFPRSLPMDTMHHLFLNVAPQIWSLSSIELLSDDDIAGINIVMASIKFPSWIERDLRNLKDAESWKAAQWKDFVTYLILPLLKHRTNTNTYAFWREVVDIILEVSAGKVLISEIPNLEQRIFKLIQSYETKFKFRSHPQIAKMMIHCLIHLPQCVVDCGPAFVYWLFPTESIVVLLILSCLIFSLFQQIIGDSRQFYSHGKKSWSKFSEQHRNVGGL